MRAAYRPSPLYGINQGHPQPHSQAMTGRRKRRESRELPLSSRQGRPTDVGEINEINTKSPAIFLSWTALSRDMLSIATLARHGHPSWSQGTSSSTIKRIPSTRTSGFDDSIRCTSVATSCNMIIGPAAFGSRFRELSAKRRKKRWPVNNDPKTNKLLREEGIKIGRGLAFDRLRFFTTIFELRAVDRSVCCTTFAGTCCSSSSIPTSKYHIFYAVTAFQPATQFEVACLLLVSSVMSS